MEYLHPQAWQRPRGFSHGVAASGRFVFVAGQIATDHDSNEINSDDFAAQVKQALANTIEVLATGGAEPAHICRMTWFITDMEAYKAAGAEIGPAYMETVGKHFPAITLVEVKSLIDPRAVIEVETVAVVPEDA
jgi:enamine deaminase RidA (YjgF/YER057c/UK114 family)